MALDWVQARENDMLQKLSKTCLPNLRDVGSSCIKFILYENSAKRTLNINLRPRAM